MLTFGRDEKTFWRTMNPVRCHALYAAQLPKESGRGDPHQQKKKPRSLAAYLRGEE